MPILFNPRHERFAHGLVAGKSADDAYVLAGFKSNRGNACSLKRKEHIITRVAELLAEREEIARAATERAAGRLSIDREWVLARLVENANRALQAEPVTISGKRTGEYRYDGNVANRALELLGKELGMFIDRKEVRSGSLDDVDGERLSALREYLIARRSGEIIGTGRAVIGEKPH